MVVLISKDSNLSGRRCDVHSFIIEALEEIRHVLPKERPVNKRDSRLSDVHSFMELYHVYIPDVWTEDDTCSVLEIFSKYFDSFRYYEPKVG